MDFREEFSDGGVTLANLSMSPGPSVEDYVNAIAKVSAINVMVPTIPLKLLIACSYMIDFIAKPLGIDHPFSHVRIRKVTASNHIVPEYLLQNQYEFQYDLETALNDWRVECPDEWH